MVVRNSILSEMCYSQPASSKAERFTMESTFSSRYYLNSVPGDTYQRSLAGALSAVDAHKKGHFPTS